MFSSISRYADRVRHHEELSKPTQYASYALRHLAIHSNTASIKVAIKLEQNQQIVLQKEVMKIAHKLNKTQYRAIEEQGTLLAPTHIKQNVRLIWADVRLPRAAVS